MRDRTVSPIVLDTLTLAEREAYVRGLEEAANQLAEAQMTGTHPLLVIAALRGLARAIRAGK